MVISFSLVPKDESTLNHLFRYEKVHFFVEQEAGFFRLCKLPFTKGSNQNDGYFNQELNIPI